MANRASLDEKFEEMEVTSARWKRGPALTYSLRDPFGRLFGRLVNIPLDMTRHQGLVFSPWRFRVPSRSELVSFQGT